MLQADKRAVFSSLVFSRGANDTSRDSDFKTLRGAFRLKAAPTTMWQLSEEDADSSDNFVRGEKFLRAKFSYLLFDFCIRNSITLAFASSMDGLQMPMLPDD